MTKKKDNPYTGVDQVKFASELQQQWIEYGNQPSANLVHNWRKMAFTLNQHLQGCGNLDRRKVWRFPLNTGGGKSTGLPYYLAMLGGLAGTRDRCPGAIVTTQYVAECKRIANEVNRLGRERYGMQEDMAVALHYGVDRRGLKLSSWPFVITTQANMIKGLVEEGNGELRGKFRRLPWLLRYIHGDDIREQIIHEMVTKGTAEQMLDRFGLDTKGPVRQRHMVIFDEMLMPLKPYDLNEDKLKALLRSIPKDIKLKHRGGVRAISGVAQEIMFSSSLHSTDERLTRIDLTEWKEQYPSIVPLYHDFMDECSGKGRMPDGAPLSYPEAMECLTAIFNIKDCGGTAALKNNGKGLYSLFKSSWLMDRLKMGFVVLDATAAESKQLDVCEDHKIVPLRPCRDYSNLTLELDTQTKRTGRGSLAGSWKADGAKEQTVQTTVGRVVDILKTEVDPVRYPKVGVISFKPIIEALKAKRMKLPFELVPGWHGNVIGRNDWNECDLIYIIGLNHMPPTYGEEMKMGIEDQIQSLKDDAEWAPYVKIPDFKWTADDLQWYDLLRDLVQVISRGSNRRTIDRGGNCRESTIRVLIGTAKKQFLIEGLKRNLRNVNIQENTWTFNPKTEMSFDGGVDMVERAEALKAKAKGLGRYKYEVGLQWFKLTGMQEVSLVRICAEFGWSGYNAKFRATLDTPKGQRLMKGLGIRFSTSVHSIKRPNGVDGLVRI